MSLPELVERARAAARAGRLSEAVALYREAAAQAPADGNLQRNLGVLLLGSGAVEEAVAALTRATELEPELPAIRLPLARALEVRGDHQGAIRHYFRALVKAQLREQWLDEASTPRALWPLVQHASEVAALGRTQILMDLLTPLQTRFGRDALRRVATSLEGYLGVAPALPSSPDQRPRFLYFPGLREQRYYTRDEFAWVEALEERTDAIALEAESQWRLGLDLQPFLEFARPEEASAYLGTAQGAAWNALFFYRGGARFNAHHDTCPHTSAALAATDLVHIAGHAPEVCFSVLAPGTHILPHTGVTNIRLVVHLPLRIPEQCALRVAGQEHIWRRGEVMVFDDTFEHEAWNRSADTRIILLMDTWHPDLTPEERMAITEIIEGIGAFHRG